MLDLYFSDKYHHHWADIVKLAQQDDAASRKKLRAYAMEACRLSTQSFGLFRRVAEPTVVEEAGKKYNLKTDDEVFVNLVFSSISKLNVRSEQTSIHLPSPIHWRSNLIVQRVRTSITDGDRIVVSGRRSIRLRIRLFYVRLQGCLICVRRLDRRGN